MTNLEHRIENLEARLDRIEGKPDALEAQLQREVAAGKREQALEVYKFYRKLTIGNAGVVIAPAQRKVSKK